MEEVSVYIKNVLKRILVLGCVALGLLGAAGCVEEVEPLVVEPAFLRDFLEAAALGDIASLEQSIADGIDVNIQNEDRLSALMLAAKNDRTEVIKLLVKLEDLDPNLLGPNDSTALLYATRYTTDPPTVNELLRAKDIDAQIQETDGYRTPLITAVMQNWRQQSAANFDVIEAMVNHPKVDVEYGAAIESDYNPSRTPDWFKELSPFYMACGNHRDVEVVKLFLNSERVTDIYRGRNGYTPLGFAVTSNDLEVIRTLLADERVAAGINRTTDYRGSTPLVSALAFRYYLQIALIEDLLDVPNINVNLGQQIGDYLSPLMTLVLRDSATPAHVLAFVQGCITRGLSLRINACSAERKTALGLLTDLPESREVEVKKEILLARGGRFTCNAKIGRKAFFEAVRGESDSNLDTIRQAIKEKISLNTFKNERGNNALIVAAQQNQLDVVELLLAEDSVTATATGYGDKTALMYAARGGHGDVLELLLDHPVQGLSLQDSDGKTALIHAVDSGRVEIVSTLLEGTGHSVNVKDLSGLTALLRAVAPRGVDAQTSIELLKVLVSEARGLQLNLCNLSKQTALKVLKNRAVTEDFTQANKDEMIDVLEKAEGVSSVVEKGAVPSNKATEFCETPLITVEDYLKSVSSGDQQGVLDALDAGLDVDATGEDGRTALMIAIDNGHVAVIDELLTTIPNINAVDAKGQTVFMHALEHDPGGAGAIIDELFDKRGLNLRAFDQGGRTTFMYAIRYGRKTVVDELLQDFGDELLLEKTVNDTTALIYAARYSKSEDIVTSLLDVLPESTINTLVEKEGNLPALFVALNVETEEDEAPNLEVIEAFIKHSSVSLTKVHDDITLPKGKDKDGKEEPDHAFLSTGYKNKESALSFAAYANEDPKVIKAILSELRTQRRDTDERTLGYTDAVSGTASSENPGTLSDVLGEDSKYLGLKIVFNENTGLTPLMKACRWNTPEVVEAMLEYQEIRDGINTIGFRRNANLKPTAVLYCVIYRKDDDVPKILQHLLSVDGVDIQVCVGRYVDDLSVISAIVWYQPDIKPMEVVVNYIESNEFDPPYEIDHCARYGSAYGFARFRKDITDAFRNEMLVLLGGIGAGGACLADDAEFCKNYDDTYEGSDRTWTGN